MVINQTDIIFRYFRGRPAGSHAVSVRIPFPSQDMDKLCKVYEVNSFTNFVWMFLEVNISGVRPLAVHITLRGWVSGKGSSSARQKKSMTTAMLDPSF